MSGSYLQDLGLNSLSPILAANGGSMGDDSEEFDLGLSLFTNSTFFDVDYAVNAASLDGEKTVGGSEEVRVVQVGGSGAGFTDFQGLEPFGNLPPLPPFAIGDALQIDPLITTVINNLPITPASPPVSQIISPVSPKANSGASKAKKQKVSSPIDLPCVAADEDKRRRNTAASARFRVKKKQREQQLQDTTKAMTEKAQWLEERVKQLEMENKWLKNLVVEKKELDGSEESVEQGSVTDA